MKRQIRKYFSIMANSIKVAITYRAELLLWSVIDAMPLLATLVLWLSAYGDRETIAGYTKNALIAYYILGYLFQDITGAHFEEDILEEIRLGTISGKLIKPFSLKLGLVVREIGWRMMTLLSSVTPILIIAFVLARDIFSQIEIKYLMFLPLFLISAYLFENIYSLIITSMGFVFEEANSLTHLKWMLGWLFSGSMMPFEFMPVGLAKLASWLPFQFRYYVPYQIIQGNLSIWEIIAKFAFALSWFFILTFLLNRLWNRNIKQFTAVGS